MIPENSNSSIEYTQKRTEEIFYSELENYRIAKKTYNTTIETLREVTNNLENNNITNQKRQELQQYKTSLREFGKNLERNLENLDKQLPVYLDTIVLLHKQMEKSQ